MLTPLYFLVSPHWLNFEFGRRNDLHIEIYNENISERLRLAEATLYFIRSKEKTDFLDSINRRGNSVYGEREKFHLVEVRNLVQKSFNLHFISLLFWSISFSIVLSNKKEKQFLPNYFLKSCTVFLFFFIVLSIAIFVHWESIFKLFHSIFFKKGTYHFAYSSALIQLFPPVFWLNTSIAWLLIILAELFISIGLLLLVKKKT